MLQANTQSDPIVEILRLAYRRGLAIQREQEGTIKSVIEGNVHKAGQAHLNRELEPEKVRAQVGK